MRLTDFKVGNKYQFTATAQDTYTCEAIIKKCPILVADSNPKATPFVVVDGSHFSPVEEWVVLLWKDEHKNSVLVNSEFFPSEQAAINKWVEHPMYIGTKQVK